MNRRTILVFLTIGVAMFAVFKPTYCYHTDHGHRVPRIVYEADRLDNMAYVQREMTKINPDFVVMTEGLADYELNMVGMFHG